jgi:hypothetical protein
MVLWVMSRNKAETIWFKTALKLYEIIKRSNFGIISLSHSLKFDLVFYQKIPYFLMNIQKIQIKNRKGKFE